MKKALMFRDKMSGKNNKSQKTRTDRGAKEWIICPGKKKKQQQQQNSSVKWGQ